MAQIPLGFSLMSNGCGNTSNHENTYVSAPIANELLERAPQLVRVKVGGFFLPSLTLFPGIYRCRIVGEAMRVDMYTGCIVT